MTGFLLGLAVCLGWLGFELGRLGRSRPRVPDTEEHVAPGWARDLRRSLPAAWEAVGLVSKRGERPTLGEAREIPFGLEWPLRTHGAVTMAEVREVLPALESALNARRPMVAATEVLRSSHEGHGRLRAWPIDPLLADNTVPWTPGHVPASWDRPACLGRFRDGSPVEVPFWLPNNGAVHTLYSGKNGSGKTRWMLLMADHVAQLGGLLFVLDPVKGIEDETWKPLHPYLAGGWSDLAAGAKGLTELSRIVRAREGWHPGSPNRFVMVLADELNDLATDRAGVKALREAVSSWRSKGASVQGAAQLPETVVIEATVRTNFRRRLAGALDNRGEYVAALGGLPPADEDRIPPPELGGAGQGFYDSNGQGPRRFRGWNASDQWRTEHYLALASYA